PWQEAVPPAAGDRAVSESLTLNLPASPLAEAPLPETTPPSPEFKPPPGFAAPPAPKSDEMPRIPGYKVERELGRGGMGVVYLAAKESDGAPVALKTIRPAMIADERSVRRFLREANILCELRHAHIVAFRHIDVADGLLFFAMDYVEGTDA